MTPTYTTFDFYVNGAYVGTSAGNTAATFEFEFPSRHDAPPSRPPPDDGLAGALAVLGVPPGAPPDAIRKAYRRRLRETHPDTGGSEEAVRRVIAAYERAIGR